jgi:hypothetical protein
MSLKLNYIVMQPTADVQNASAVTQKLDMCAAHVLHREVTMGYCHLLVEYEDKI